MSKDRKEPTFSPITQDETAAPPSGKAGASSPGVKAAVPKNKSSVAAEPRRPRPVSEPLPKSSPLIPLALLLALTGLGLAGFSYWQLLMAQQQVSLAEKRISSLEDRLKLSDSESSQSVTVLQANLRESQDSLALAHTEIRKLWDTRNVNKKAISGNAQQLAKLQKSTDSISSVAMSGNKLARELKKSWEALAANQSLQTEQLGVMSDLTTQQQKRLRDLTDVSNKLDSDLKQLKSQLSGRVKSNEEAVQAIDGFRRQVNREILEIKQRLGTAPR